MADTLFILIVSFLIGSYLLNQLLDYLNARNWSDTLPDTLAELYDKKEYKRSQEYDKVKAKLSMWSGTFSVLLVLGLLFGSGFALLDEWCRAYSDIAILQGLLFFGVLFFAGDLLSLPFQLYGTFVIEEKFGFNRMDVKTFVTDKLKGYALAVLLGGGLISFIIWVYTNTGEWFWLITWVTISGFGLIISMFYTSLIVPLFNKLSPLEEGPLRSQIESYCSRVGFSLKNVFVMDGSKRSSKANAYFSGLGPRKTIVLFDTLIKEHEPEELVAVIAHEAGHYKKKHILKGLLLSTVQNGILLYILGWLLGNPVLAASLGVAEPSFHIGLLAFGLLYTPISLLLGIVGNMVSRANEFEADAYAKQTSDGGSLQRALKKLSVKNLSNLNPHPAYVFFHYSHPPLLKRLEALGVA